MMVEFEITTNEWAPCIPPFSFSYTVLMIPAGRLADRVGPRRVLAWMAFGSAALTALVAVAGTPGLGSLIGVFPALILLRLCGGASMSPMYPASGRMNANWAPAHLHSRVQALVNTGAGVSAAISPVLSAAMIRAYGGGRRS